MEEAFYFICVEAGEEPWLSDGFATYEERCKATREQLRHPQDIYNILYLEIDSNGRPHIQSYSDCVDDDFDESDYDLDEFMEDHMDLTGWDKVEYWKALNTFEEWAVHHLVHGDRRRPEESP